MAGVADAGLGRDLWLTINDGDGVALLVQKIGGGNADDAGAENDDVHGV